MVLGAFKHHVLEQMGKTRSAGFFVLRADVIPEVHSRDRQRVVLRKNDIKTVR